MAKLEQYPNPWLTKRTDLKYANPWITVEENQVINPSGKPGIYGVVHFKNLAIGIVPVDEEGYTWLVGQYRYPLNEYTWEIPEGGGPIGIDPLKSAQRELREETGLLAERWTYLSRIHTSNSVCNEEGHLYLAQGLTQGPTEFEETEDLKIKKIHLREALTLVLDNQITDSLSIVGIMKACKVLGLL
jgi:8-oxo-dGTP pyrophosphatase MutT (NUDIX family)